MSSEDDTSSDYEQMQYVLMIVELRKKAFRQILYGLAWWSGSAVAMYFALASTSSGYYWYGGALGALFHWHRAFKLISATVEAGAKPFLKNEIILIACTAIVVFFSSSKIVPEYFKIDTPTIGTCWAKESNGLMIPTACWSDSAIAKTIDFASSSSACPSISTGYFDPSESESRFTCLTNIE
jgi:hypothetical protein